MSAIRRTSPVLTIGKYAALAFYLIFALFPLYWLVKISITPDRLTFSEGTALWPSEATLANFRSVIFQSDFLAYFGNSLIVSLGTAAATTLIAAGAGYAFSRFNFGGKRLIIALMLVTQMFPLLMIIAPIYKIVAAMGLLNSLTSLIVVYTAFNVPFATFLMQSFFDGIPKDLEEAAMIDGATRFTAFRQIILPLTLPGIMVGAFLTFVLCIGDYITPQILGGNAELTLPQLIMLQMGRSGNFPMASALSVVLMAVVTLAYAGCCRWLRLDRL